MDVHNPVGVGVYKIFRNDFQIASQNDELTAVGLQCCHNFRVEILCVFTRFFVDKYSWNARLFGAG